MLKPSKSVKMTKHRAKLGHLFTQTFRVNLHKRAGARDRRKYFGFETLRHSFESWETKVGLVVLLGSVKKTRAGLFLYRIFVLKAPFCGFCDFSVIFTFNDANKMPTFAFYYIIMKNHHANCFVSQLSKTMAQNCFCDNKIFPYDMKGNQQFWSKTGPKWTENKPKL